MVKNILMNDYGYTETQANYAIKNANIDWKYYALIHLEEFVGMNEGNQITKEDIELYLGNEKGYTSEDIAYAFKNTNINWANNTGNSTSEMPNNSSEETTLDSTDTPSETFPPQIQCSEWVSLKELQDKAGYYVDTSSDVILISYLGKNKFTLTGCPDIMQNGKIYNLYYNGTIVKFKYESTSNYVYENMKLRYTDLVNIGVLS